MFSPAVKFSKEQNQNIPGDLKKDTFFIFFTLSLSSSYFLSSRHCFQSLLLDILKDTRNEVIDFSASPGESTGQLLFEFLLFQGLLISELGTHIILKLGRLSKRGEEF